MSKRLYFMAAPLVAAHLLMASAASPALAEDTPTADTVVATVNGTAITLGHMMLVRADLPAQYQQLPDDVLFQGILDQIVSQTLLEQSLTGDVPAAVRLATENEHRSLMAAEAIRNLIATGLTDEAVKAAYDEKYAGDPGKEYHAAHILVETEDEAKALIAQLQEGADFATLAKEHSTGPSGPSGGDLGWFGTGQMVPEFEEAVIALEPGAFTLAPVQTQFGWHVIILHESRAAEAPALDDVRDEIESELQTQLVEKRIEELRSTAAIDQAAESSFDPAILKDPSLLEN